MRKELAMNFNELSKFVYRKYGLKFKPALSGSTELYVLSSPLDQSYFAMMSRIRQDNGYIATLDLRCGDFSEVIRDLPGFSTPFRLKSNDWVGIWLDKVDQKSIENAFDYAFKLMLNGEEQVTDKRPLLFIPGEDVDAKYESQAIPKRNAMPRREENIPEAIKKMKEVYDYSILPAKGRNKNFYNQGKAIEDYRDNFKQKIPFKRYYPTYHAMSLSQLRTYFAWRTKIRDGKYEKIDTSYAFVYIYELLNNICCENPEDGYQKLQDFFDNYVEKYDLEIARYLKPWLKDYVLFYQLNDQGEQVFSEEIQADHDYQIIHHPTDYEDDELFETLKKYSPYLAKCPTAEKMKEQFPHIVAVSWRRLVQTDNFFKKYVAKRGKQSHFLFAGAVFYFKNKQTCEFTVDSERKYVINDDIAEVDTLYPIKRQQAELNVVFHEIDRLIRQIFHLGRPIKAKKLEVEYLTAIKQGIKLYQEQVEEAKRPKIEIDFTSLNKIRSDASVTRESLLTEEEKQLEAQEQVEEEKIKQTNTETVQVENDYELDPDEMFFLIALIKKQSWQDYLKKHHLMASILADSINEKLFDKIGDSVIEFNENDQPEIIEDYQEDLEELFLKKE